MFRWRSCSRLGHGPIPDLSVQFCRPLLYAVYFFAGVGLGAAGIDRGLVAADGVLARRWNYGSASALVRCSSGWA